LSGISMMAITSGIRCAVLMVSGTVSPPRLPLVR
jgi:hypothetical protein